MDGEEKQYITKMMEVEGQFVILFLIIIINLMRNNLQIFREEIKNYLKSDQIANIDQFKELANHLCDVKLLHPQEVKKLIHKFGNSNQIKFPINLPQFELIIMNQFGDKQLQQMLNDFNDLKKALRKTKGVISIWKDKGISKRERAELESIFENGNQKLREFYAVLENQKKILQQICQQDIQMIDSLQEWIQMQKITQPFKDYKQYQSHHQKLIEQQFNKLKVREVHFKQRVNTAKINKVEIALGMDSRNDEPVEVVLIPKKTLEFDVLNVELLTFNAKKQLMLSSHFNRFLGYNTHCDQNCFFYFNEYIEGQNLDQYINTVKIQLEQDTPLFKYWSSVIYKALYDIFLMSSYVPRLPITLKDIEVSASGLKLIIKHIKFVENRQQNEKQFYEAELLQNLGELVLSLLKLTVKGWEQKGKVSRIQNKSIINCLLHAENGSRNYKQGRVKNRLSFFNLQTHPLFESANLLQGELVIDNYQSILRYT